MMRIPTVAGLALLAACYATDPTAPIVAARASLDEPFQLRVGQWADVADGDLWIRFVGVAQDSRCPSNALILCVWEGEGVVAVEWAPRDADVAQADTLRTRQTANTIVLDSWVLELVRLDPYPEDVDPIPSSEYLATFAVHPRP